MNALLFSALAVSMVLWPEITLAGWDLAAPYPTGPWAPLLIVLLRGGAALLAVVPSSPVVLAAGLTEGPVWGTIYVLIGAEAGALTAFFIGRRFGRSFVERRGWMAPIAKSRYGRWLLEGNTSQARLMASVFYCRLLPGLNLDGVSYVAGISPIAVWRFALATLGGLLPYTIILVVIGRQLAEMSLHEAIAVVMFVVFAGAVPWVWMRTAPLFRRDARKAEDVATTKDRP